MMKKTLKILKSKEIKEIVRLLGQEFGFAGDLKAYAVLRNTKDKMYLVNREIATIPLDALGIDSVGMYFGEVMDHGIRLSIEGSQLIGKQCKKNVIEIDAAVMRTWLKGQDIEIAGQHQGYVLLKCGKEFLGCGRYKEGKVLNYIPKARRILAED